MELDYKVIDVIEDKLNDLVDNVCDLFSSKPVAAEIAISCATLATQMAIAGGVTKQQYLILMEDIWNSTLKEQNNRMNMN